MMDMMDLMDQDRIDLLYLLKFQFSKRILLTLTNVTVTYEDRISSNCTLVGMFH